MRVEWNTSAWSFQLSFCSDHWGGPWSGTSEGIPAHGIGKILSDSDFNFTEMSGGFQFPCCVVCKKTQLEGEKI